MTNETENEIVVKKKRSGKSIAIEVALYLLLFVVCVVIIPKFIVQRTVVSGESMENTLLSKDNLLIQKVSLHFTNPGRYDIIVFRPKVKKDEDLIVKRVFGLPGETIQIKGDQIYINGKILDDPYGKNVMLPGDEGLAASPITLKENEFFVLGDNREVSRDSRSEDIGVVSKSQIEGLPFLRIWPFSRFGGLYK